MHIMIDLETLSSNSNAAVIQIGAVAFGLAHIGPEFKATIDIADAMKYGEVSPSTLKWWMSQSDSARTSAMSGTTPLVDALHDLNAFIEAQGKDVQFWAHATFDFPVIMNAYNACGVKPAIPYKKMRDLRTLEMFWSDFIAWEAREGTHHDALDDAKFQASHAQLMLREADTALQRRQDEAA
jgi:hypothetical protein